MSMTIEIKGRKAIINYEWTVYLKVQKSRGKSSVIWNNHSVTQVLAPTPQRALESAMQSLKKLKYITWNKIQYEGIGFAFWDDKDMQYLSNEDRKLIPPQQTLINN